MPYIPHNYRILSLLILYLTYFTAQSQWTGKIVKSKYDGNFGYAEVKLKSLESNKALILRIEANLDVSPVNMCIMITDGYFCGESVGIVFQIDTEEGVIEYNLPGVSFDGNSSISLGEYSLMGHEELYQSLIAGKGGRITIFNSHCGTERYHLNLNGSSKSIRRLLNAIREKKRNTEYESAEKVRFEKGDTVYAKPNVGLHILKKGRLVRLHKNFFAEGVYTGNIINQWEEIYIEINFGGHKYYVVEHVVDYW